MPRLPRRPQHVRQLVGEVRRRDLKVLLHFPRLDDRAQIRPSAHISIGDQRKAPSWRTYKLTEFYLIIGHAFVALRPAAMSEMLQLGPMIWSRIVTRRGCEGPKGVGSEFVRTSQVVNFCKYTGKLPGRTFKQKQCQDKPVMRCRDTGPLTECILKTVQPPLCLGISAMRSSHGQADLLPRSTVVRRFGPHDDSGYSQMGKAWHVRNARIIGSLPVHARTYQTVPNEGRRLTDADDRCQINFHMRRIPRPSPTNVHVVIIYV
jgi:hypothetical protein